MPFLILLGWFEMAKLAEHKRSVIFLWIPLCSEIGESRGHRQNPDVSRRLLLASCWGPGLLLERQAFPTPFLSAQGMGQGL